MEEFTRGSMHDFARTCGLVDGSAARRRLVALFVVVAALACSPTGNPNEYEALVFPAEARLGATAAILIDSNYFPLSDDYERYDLRNDNVRILVDDGSGPVEATLRQVFDLASAAWSRYAQNHPGAWTSVAMFNLPASGLSVPGTATVSVEIDGVVDATRQGRIEIVGSGGVPTDIVFPGSGETAEYMLESEPLLRLRAVRADGGNPGFQDAWTIGGIEFDLEYFVCLKNARVFPDSNASGATSMLGPVVDGEPWFRRTHVVLVDPEGFQLAQPNDALGLASPTSAGEGPFVTLAFDRGGAVTCTQLGAGLFKIENLHVTDVDGTTLIDRDGAGAGDATDLVELIVVDTEAS